MWHGDDWSPKGKRNVIEKVQLADSDIITFHSYDWPERFQQRIDQLRPYGRPLICTEYMARGVGSTIDTIAPLAKRENVGIVNWGFVVGKTQTNLPWNSWQRPYTLQPPMVWFHDLLHQNGTPYREREAAILKALTHSPKGVLPPIALAPAVAQP